MWLLALGYSINTILALLIHFSHAT
jgi:hypothetical protein